jgi:hypothetical protein
MGKNICPLLSSGGKKVKCIEHDCHLWTHIIGRNPQTGAEMDRWDCAISWLPVLLVENAGEQRKTQASIQHLNNQLHVTFATLSGRRIPALSGNDKRDQEVVKSISEGG